MWQAIKNVETTIKRVQDEGERKRKKEREDRKGSIELKIVPTVGISKLWTRLTTRVVIRLKSEILGFESKDCQAVWLSERGEVSESEEGKRSDRETRLIIFINHYRNPFLEKCLFLSLLFASLPPPYIMAMILSFSLRCSV